MVVKKSSYNYFSCKVVKSSYNYFLREVVKK